MTRNTDDEIQFDACDHCGVPFELEVKYPITTLRTAEGTLEVYSFCDDECKSSWESER